MIAGAGSTFAASLLAEWLVSYRRIAPGVDVRYEAIGSPAGVRRLAQGAVGFAVSDVPLSDADAEAFEERGPPTQIPWIAGAVTIAYNLPGVDDLRLSPGVLAAIFAGRLTRWNDPLVRADNPDSNLPAAEI